MKKKIFTILLIGLCLCNLVSCGRSTEQNEIKEQLSSIINSDLISEETANTGINEDDPDILNLLEPGTYYVLHNGVYYPTQLGKANYDTSDINIYSSDPNYHHYFVGQDDDNIPTLFLENGDKLIYYDPTDTLDYTIFDRYYDNGYTIGMYNIQSMESGKMYIDISDDNEFGSILESSTMYNLIKDGTLNYIYVNSINQAEINKDVVHYGLINYTEPGALYNIELYDGTNYIKYYTLANMHTLIQMEKYAVRDCKALQSYIFEIPIPEYLNDGYYGLSSCSINGNYMSGIFRYVKGSSFSNNPDNFNNRLLYTQEILDEIESTGYFEQNGYISIYSDYEPLNKFTCDIEGYFGYVSEDTNSTNFNNSIIEDPNKEKIKIKLNNSSTIILPINFKANKKCHIEIIPKEAKEDAQIFIQTGLDTKQAITLNKLSKTYTFDFDGDGNTYALLINNLLSNYTIKLTNCTKDNYNNILFPIITDLNGNKINESYNYSLTLLENFKSGIFTNSMQLSKNNNIYRNNNGVTFTVLNENRYIAYINDIDNKKYILSKDTNKCYSVEDIFSNITNITLNDLLNEMK